MYVPGDTFLQYGAIYIFVIKWAALYIFIGF